MYNIIRAIALFLGGYFVGDTKLLMRGGWTTGGWTSGPTTSGPTTNNLFSGFPKWFLLAFVFVGYLIFKELNK